MKKSIGGDFSYPISHLFKGSFGSFNDKLIYSSGRSSLSLILKSIKNFESEDYTVLSPSFACQSLEESYKELEIPFKLYPVNNELRLDRKRFKDLDKNANYIFVLISYFGIVKVKDDIYWIKNYFPNSIVINDLAQDLWSFLEEDSEADYSFSSLRKALASPDGGLIKTKDKDLLAVKKRISLSSKRIIAAIFKNSGLVTDHIYLKYFKEAEAEFKATPSLCSSFTKNILSHTNLEKVEERRKENSQHAVYYARKHGLKLLLEPKADDVPLCIPLLIPNRDKVRSQLIKKGIFLPVHWPLSESSTDPVARKISEEILSLVIDQRCSKKDVERQIDEFLKGITHADIRDS